MDNLQAISRQDDHFHPKVFVWSENAFSPWNLSRQLIFSAHMIYVDNLAMLSVYIVPDHQHYNSSDFPEQELF